MADAKLLLKKEKYSSSFRSPLYILLLSESELGIPKRRKSSSKLAASLFVSKETGRRMAQKLTDCTVQISFQKKKGKQRNWMRDLNRELPRRKEEFRCETEELESAALSVCACAHTGPGERFEIVLHPNAFVVSSLLSIKCQHIPPCVLYIRTGVSLLSRERFLYI